MSRIAIPFVPLTRDDPATESAQQLTQLILNNEAMGWRFCHLESVTTLQRNGCLAGLMGNPTTTLVVQVAIFERD